MIRRPPRSTRTDTLFPYTTLFRSTSKGIEGSLSIFPFPNFDITASGAYQDIAYDDYPGAACLATQVADGSCNPTDPTSIENNNLAGYHPANTSKLTGSDTATARFDIHRKDVEEGKSGSERVDSGVVRYSKKRNKKKTA